ncbi:MAG: hypothetical protein ACT4OI_03700 [Methanobacteriota archaeon]
MRRVERRTPLAAQTMSGRINVRSVIMPEKRRTNYIRAEPRSSPPSTMVRVRPVTLGAACGAYFAAVVFLAWNQAKDLSQPWYLADLSRWVYTTYFLGASLLLAGVVAGASRRAASLDRRIALLQADIRSGGFFTSAEAPDAEDHAPEPDAVDRDIDDLLDRLSDIETAEAGTDAVVVEQVEAPRVVAAAPPPRTTGPELAREHQRLTRSRKAIRGYAAGPAVVATLFLGLSGAMLPAVDVFLQTFHQLNTVLVLSLGYGWFGLGAYAGASAFALLGED